MILSGQSKNFFLLIDLLGSFLPLVFFAIQGTGRVQAESMGKTLLVANTSVLELAKKYQHLLFPYQRFRSTGGRPVRRIRTNIGSKFFALPSLGKASEKNLLPLYRQHILLLEVVAFGVLSGLLMCSAHSRRENLSA